jgi:hypothetical protein
MLRRGFMGNGDVLTHGVQTIKFLNNDEFKVEFLNLEVGQK